VLLSSLVPVLFVVAPVWAQERDAGKAKNGGPDSKAPAVVTPSQQRVSGVIVKAEPIRKGATSRSDNVESEKGRAPTHRITINTAAVWRDWVRDQAGIDPGATPREAAKRGDNSVATKGEPETAGTLVVIDIGPATKIETLFREATDETSKGAKTPAEARAASEDPAAAKASGGTSKSEKSAETPRITRYQVDDLQPGLFVETDFAQKDGRDLASTLAVVRPTGGSDTPDRPAGGEGKAKGKAKAKAKAKQ